MHCDRWSSCSHVCRLSAEFQTSLLALEFNYDVWDCLIIIINHMQMWLCVTEAQPLELLMDWPPVKSSMKIRSKHDVDALSVKLSPYTSPRQNMARREIWENKLYNTNKSRRASDITWVTLPEEQKRKKCLIKLKSVWTQTFSRHLKSKLSTSSADALPSSAACYFLPAKRDFLVRDKKKKKRRKIKSKNSAICSFVFCWVCK